MSKDCAYDTAFETSYRFDSIILVFSNGPAYSVSLEEDFLGDDKDIVSRIYGGEIIL